MGDISAGLTDLWRSVILFVPKAIAFLAILLLGWIVALVVRKAVNRVLRRTGFDRAVQRGGIGRALERADYDASKLLARLAYYALLLVTLQMAFGVWGPNPVSGVIAAVVAWLPKAFVAVVIVVVVAAIAGAVRDLVGGALAGTPYGSLLASTASTFVIGLGVIAALNQIGVATTVTTAVLIAILATMAGIVIVGVGGGLVQPMARRWDGWLDRAGVESQAIGDSTLAYRAGRDDVARRMADREPARHAAEAMARSAGRRSGARSGGGTGAGGGRSAGQPATIGGSHTYESGNATGATLDETQRIDPDL